MLDKQAYGLAVASTATLVWKMLFSAVLELPCQASAAQSLHRCRHTGNHQPAAVSTALGVAHLIAARSPRWLTLQEPGNCTLVVGATGGVGQVLTGKLLDVCSLQKLSAIGVNDDLAELALS